jgi:hypothetical protein
MQLLQLIEQGIELIVEGALLALDRDDSRQQTVDVIAGFRRGGERWINGRESRGFWCGGDALPRSTTSQRSVRPRNRSNHTTSGL